MIFTDMTSPNASQKERRVESSVEKCNPPTNTTAVFSFGGVPVSVSRNFKSRRSRPRPDPSRMSWRMSWRVIAGPDTSPVRGEAIEFRTAAKRGVGASRLRTTHKHTTRGEKTTTFMENN